MTSVEDIINIIKKLILNPKLKKYQILNIGNQEPVKTKTMLNFLIKYLCKKTKIINAKRNSYEVIKTFSNSKKIIKITNFKIYTNFEKGLKEFVEWYLKWKKFKK